MFEKEVAADAAKTKEELAAEEAEENARWRQSRYFREQVFGSVIGGDRRSMLWSQFPDRRNLLFRR